MSEEEKPRELLENVTKTIHLPNGEVIDPSEIGADFVSLHHGDSKYTVPEIVDQSDLLKDLRERENFVSKQPLVRSIADKSPTADIIDHVVAEIAEELSHLKYERTKKARDGHSTSSLTVSRILSLRQLSEVLMKRMENARAEQLNLKSPRFREVLKLWMEFVYESMQKTNVQDEVIDLVFRQMEADMEGWERRVLDTVELGPSDADQRGSLQKLSVRGNHQLPREKAPAEARRIRRRR